MGMHLVAFTETRSAAQTEETAITPAPDPTVTTNGKLLYVPEKYNKVILTSQYVNAGVNNTSSLHSPSLREFLYPTLTPINVGSVPAGATPFQDFSDDPLKLVSNEGLQYFTDANNGVTAAIVDGFVIFSDSKVTKATGDSRPIHATATPPAATTGWSSGAITFSQTLPVGNYDIVGMRATGASTLAARLIFIGASGVTRPGVLSVPTVNSDDIPLFRRGNFGLFGTFSSTTPPSVEVFGGSGGTVEIELDIIKR